MGAAGACLLTALGQSHCSASRLEQEALRLRRHQAPTQIPLTRLALPGSRVASSETLASALRPHLALVT